MRTRIWRRRVMGRSWSEDSFERVGRGAFSRSETSWLWGRVVRGIWDVIAEEVILTALESGVQNEDRSGRVLTGFLR